MGKAGSISALRQDPETKKWRDLSVLGKVRSPVGLRFREITGDWTGNNSESDHHFS